MKLEDCKKCQHHYKSQLDDILCVFSGGYDYRVIAQDKKGSPVVVMCPVEMPLPRRVSVMATNLKSVLDIS